MVANSQVDRLFQLCKQIHRKWPKRDTKINQERWELLNDVNDLAEEMDGILLRNYSLSKSLLGKQARKLWEEIDGVAAEQVCIDCFMWWGEALHPKLQEASQVILVLGVSRQWIVDMCDSRQASFFYHSRPAGMLYRDALLVDQKSVEQTVMAYRVKKGEERAQAAREEIEKDKRLTKSINAYYRNTPQKGNRESQINRAVHLLRAVFGQRDINHPYFDSNPFITILPTGTLMQTIRQVLATVNLRERLVLIARFGLANGISATLEETGRLMDVTRERIRQIEAKALRKIRHPSRSKQFDPFLNLYTWADKQAFLARLEIDEVAGKHFWHAGMPAEYVEVIADLPRNVLRETLAALKEAADTYAPGTNKRHSIRWTEIVPCILDWRNGQESLKRLGIRKLVATHYKIPSGLQREVKQAIADVPVGALQETLASLKEAAGAYEPRKNHARHGWTWGRMVKKILGQTWDGLQPYLARLEIFEVIAQQYPYPYFPCMLPKEVRQAIESMPVEALQGTLAALKEAGNTYDSTRKPHWTRGTTWGQVTKKIIVGGVEGGYGEAILPR